MNKWTGYVVLVICYISGVIFAAWGLLLLLALGLKLYYDSVPELGYIQIVAGIGLSAMSVFNIWRTRCDQVLVNELTRLRGQHEAATAAIQGLMRHIEKLESDNKSKTSNRS